MGDTVFLDLDGTLLRNDKSISPFTVETLKAVRALGNRLVFATARPVRAIRRLLPDALHGDWFLAGNGARAVQGGAFLWDETLDPELVANLTTRLAAVPGVILALEALDTLAVSALPWNHSQGDVFAVEPSLIGRAVAANKILVQGVSTSLDEAETLLPPHLSRVRTDGGTLLQIMPPGISKGAAVRRLLSSLPPGSGTTIGFGDDLNDLPLFEACSLTVAPANAVAELRARATLVLRGTNDDDAVAAYLADHYLDRGLQRKKGTAPPAELYQPRSLEEWRNWLAAHHAASRGVWLIQAKTVTSLPRVEYVEAVEEALCWGWIDSVTKPYDSDRRVLWFSPRQKGSGWAKTNKERLLRLATEGRLQPAGRAVIEQAQRDGSWTLLDGPEAGVVPDDLAAALGSGVAREYFDALPPGERKRILTWLVQAKTAATRTRRLELAARRCGQQIRFDQWTKETT